MELPGMFSNPLGWVHAQVMGGWKRCLQLGLGYGGFALLLIVIMIRSAINEGVTPTSACQVVLSILMALQAGMMFMFISAGVRRAVQKDFTSGMIESHRQSPISGWSAVLGYLTGPCTQIAGITAANLLLALLLNVYGGMGMGGWLLWVMGLLVALIPAYAIASLLLMMALSTKGSATAMGMVIFLLAFGGANLMWLVPGLGIMTGVYSVTDMVQSASRGRFKFDPMIGFALAAQLGIIAIACAASARRFVSDARRAFTWELGVCLTVLLAIGGFVGLRIYATRYQQEWGLAGMNVPFDVQWLATLVAILLGCVIPISAAVWHRVGWLRRKAVDPEWRHPAPRSVGWVLLLIVIFVSVIGGWSLGIPLYDLSPEWRSFCGRIHMDNAERSSMALALVTAVTTGLALLPIAGLLRMIFGFRDRFGGILLFWIALAWGVPFLVEALSMAYSAKTRPMDSWFMGCSPIGWWALLLNEPKSSLWGGLAVQAVLAAVVGILLPGWVGSRQIRSYQRKVEKADAAPAAAAIAAPAAPAP